MSQPPSTRIPICFYCVASHLGGAERSTLDLILALRSSEKYEPWVLLPESDGAFPVALLAAGVKVESLSMPPGFFKISRDKPFQALMGLSRSAPALGIYFMRLVRLLHRHETRLIHTTGIKCHLIAALLLPLHRLAVLWHIRDILPKGPVLAGFQTLLHSARGTFPKKLWVIFNSGASSQAFPRLRQSRVIHNGLDPTRYLAEKSTLLRRKFKIPKGAPIVGVLGVFARWKGQLEFIQMASALLKSGTPAHFVLIGGRIYDTVSDLDYERELHAAADSAPMPEGAVRIHFTGYLAQPEEALRSLDILVHASTRPEPFGRVVLEAMACGVPVVASGAGGVLELIGDGMNGLLFAPGDVTEMAQAVGRLLKEPELASALAAKASEDFREGFTLEAHVRRISEFYDEILGS